MYINILMIFVNIVKSLNMYITYRTQIADEPLTDRHCFCRDEMPGWGWVGTEVLFCKSTI